MAEKNPEKKDQTFYNIEEEDYNKNLSNEQMQLYKELTDDTEVQGFIEPKQTVKVTVNTRIKKR